MSIEANRTRNERYVDRLFAAADAGAYPGVPMRDDLNSRPAPTPSQRSDEYKPTTEAEAHRYTEIGADRMYKIEVFDPKTGEFKTLTKTDFSVRVVSTQYNEKVIFETDDPEYNG